MGVHTQGEAEARFSVLRSDVGRARAMLGPMQASNEQPTGVTDHWREVARQWVAWARTPGHDVFFWDYNLPVLLDLLPQPGLLTVDLGCGEGRLGRELTARGHRVVGVDASAVLASAAATHPQSPQHAVIADGGRTPAAIGHR